MREREADVDETIVPLEEMYGLLSRYEVRGRLRGSTRLVPYCVSFPVSNQSRSPCLQEDAPELFTAATRSQTQPEVDADLG